MLSKNYYQAIEVQKEEQCILDLVKSKVKYICKECLYTKIGAKFFSHGCLDQDPVFLSQKSVNERYIQFLLNNEAHKICRFLLDNKLIHYQWSSIERNGFNVCAIMSEKDIPSSFPEDILVFVKKVQDKIVGYKKGHIDEPIALHFNSKHEEELLSYLPMDEEDKVILWKWGPLVDEIMEQCGYRRKEYIMPYISYFDPIIPDWFLFMVLKCQEAAYQFVENRKFTQEDMYRISKNNFAIKAILTKDTREYLDTINYSNEKIIALNKDQLTSIYKNSSESIAELKPIENLTLQGCNRPPL